MQPENRHLMSYLLPYALIEWPSPQTPYSPMFNDIYWSKNQRLEVDEDSESKISGLQEKKHVFIEGNHLRERWANLDSQNEFTILETGFGFGLNFILSLELKQLLNEDFTLHYVAFEQFPVSPDDLSSLNKIIQNSWLEKLIAHYPQPIPGTHHIWLTEKICLTLILGDITTTLPDLVADVDACFLDGFSPSKNELMWQSNIYSHISTCLRPGASCSSYSVAGHVRRGLQAENLNVSKVRGYANKAEMLYAQAWGEWKAKEKIQQKISIIGAGLSGLFCAHAFKRRGISCSLFEAEKESLGAVKGMTQLAVYPQLSATPQKTSLFSLHAFSFLGNHFNYHKSGRLQILDTSEKIQKAEKLCGFFDDDFLLLLDEKEASRVAGIKINHKALYFPQAGWMKPSDISAICEVLINFEAKINQLEKVDSSWLLSFDDRSSTKSDIVILTTGAKQCSYLDSLNLIPVRGQSLQLTLPNTTVNTIIENQISLFPDHQGLHTVAATFNRNDPEDKPRSEDTRLLLDQVSNLINTKLEPQEPCVQVGHRMTTRDRIPVYGELADGEALQRYCQSPLRDRKAPFKDFAHKLYCAVGFGSHGATLSPYCSELLAREINNEPRSRDNKLTSTLRFAFRDSGTKFV
ncbi:MAG: tRNA 5-methylaminomethyl-2-thiouridine biosynthesis bifunctional protein [Candidatus Azotimanducaceae bacterium]|jgi:tRNA 5-methylaminomethyl-2-thiouridine biosynthesis bifunctional protein